MRFSAVVVLVSLLQLVWPLQAAQAGVDVVFTSQNSDGESVCAARIIAEMRKAKVLSEASLRKPAELDETFFEKQGTSAKEVASYADGEALSGAIDKMKASP